jgi:hypothetical protein
MSLRGGRRPGEAQRAWAEKHSSRASEVSWMQKREPSSVRTSALPISTAANLQRFRPASLVAGQAAETTPDGLPSFARQNLGTRSGAYMEYVNAPSAPKCSQQPRSTLFVPERDSGSRVSGDYSSRHPSRHFSYSPAVAASMMSSQVASLVHSAVQVSSAFAHSRGVPLSWIPHFSSLAACLSHASSEEHAPRAITARKKQVR